MGTIERRGAEGLVDLLVRQEAMVIELGELSRRQAALIETERTDVLLGLLGRRQEVIDRFVASQEELARLTDEARRGPDRPDDRQRELIRGLVDRIAVVLQEVMARDEQDQIALQAGRSDVQDKLTALGDAMQARAVYLRGGRSDNRFTDHTG